MAALARAPSSRDSREGAQLITSRANTMPLSRCPPLLHLLVAAMLLGMTLSAAAEEPVSAPPAVQVVIEGIDGALLENVRLLLSIEQQRNSPDLSPARLRRLHDKAPGEIALALQPYGFYRARIDAQLHQEADGSWVARYGVEPGTPLPLRQVEVVLQGEALEDEAFGALLKENPLRSGQPLNHPLYERYKRELLRLAEERGYFDAAFSKQTIRIALQPYHADITLQFDSGRRYRFGAVTFSGAVALGQPLLQRYLPFASGEPYSAAQLQTLQQTLSQSDYFDHVEVRVEREQKSDGMVPISVALTMRPRSKYRLGLGYGTDTGPRTSAGLERRYTNRRGHRFATELMLAQFKQSAAANYAIPLENPVSDRIVLRSEYRLDQTGDLDSRAVLVGADVERGSGRWRRSYGLNYQLEDFEIGLQSGTSRLLMPSLSWMYVESAPLLYLIHGSRTTIELRGAAEGAGSDTSFFQARLLGKYIVPLRLGRFLFRGEAGAINTREFEQLPPSIRFFAGGDYSVRGYAYKSLGPADSAGNIVGGRYLLVGSAEYEIGLGEKWSGALFVDAGDAFDEGDTLLARGVGFGLRRKLPIGWLRVDLARAISLDGQPWRLHLTIGPDL
ncbi:MAG: autotransporter assembly complex protein TamA [Gammaproteobacteria bacterium]|nr:autotransporter assembly complex protein TamA [Gammaproteobacteria bacterium]